MIYRRADARSVVKQDGAGLGVSELELCQHNGNIVKRQLIQYRFFLAERENRYALYLALKHASHTCGQDRRIAVRGTDQDLVAMRHCNLFETLDQFRKEWICNVLDNDSQKAAAARNQRARVSVRKIIQMFNCLPHAFRQPFTHYRRTVDGS
jgi:hypothetical protein